MIALKEIADNAMNKCAAEGAAVHKCLVLKRLGAAAPASCRTMVAC